MTDFHPTPILVPTDLSATSAEAVRIARQIAPSDADVVVVYVGLDHDLIAPAHIWGMAEITPDNGEERRQRLDKWVTDNELGDVRQELRSGDPGLEICALAKELSCPLIVIPSHGRKGLTRILLGSVAERVIRHAECSVLIVRRDGTNGGTSPNWLPRKHVVVPVDLSESTTLAVESALKLVDDEMHVDIINVVYTMSDAMVTGSIAVSQDDLRDNREECLRRYLDEHGWGSLNTHVLFGEPGATIADYADDVDADLVVMPSHGFHGLDRLLLGSTTERVLRHTKAPVLVLRRKDT